MSESPHDPSTDPELHDQDAEPASRPEGAAAAGTAAEDEAGDQDAGPASA